MILRALCPCTNPTFGGFHLVECPKYVPRTPCWNSHHPLDAVYVDNNLLEDDIPCVLYNLRVPATGDPEKPKQPTCGGKEKVGSRHTIHNDLHNLLNGPRSSLGKLYTSWHLVNVVPKGPHHRESPQIPCGSPTSKKNHWFQCFC